MDKFHVCRLVFWCWVNWQSKGNLCGVLGQTGVTGELVFLYSGQIASRKLFISEFGKITDLRGISFFGVGAIDR